MAARTNSTVAAAAAAAAAAVTAVTVQCKVSTFSQFLTRIEYGMAWHGMKDNIYPTLLWHAYRSTG